MAIDFCKTVGQNLSKLQEILVAYQGAYVVSVEMNPIDCGLPIYARPVKTIATCTKQSIAKILQGPSDATPLDYFDASFPIVVSIGAVILGTKLVISIYKWADASA